MSARIIATDNFNMSGERPGCDEFFVLWSMPEEDADKICAILNKQNEGYDPYYFKTVSPDYKLQKFEP